MKKNSRSKNRRTQVSKPAKSGNTPYMEGMQELRRSNAAGPHRAGNEYRRTPKRKGWNNDY
jgi:hypothetical protein